MLSKNQIKKLKSLSSAKFRQKYNNFIAEGHKLATEILLSQTFEIEHIFALNEWLDTNDKLINHIDASLITIIGLQEMKQISNLSTHSSIFILLKKPDVKVKDSLIKGKFSFLLQGVQDPGNVGTIIRIADWFGIPNIITDQNTADLFHPKVVQSSMGSICNTNLMRTDEFGLLNLVDSYPSYALSLNGEAMDKSTFDKPGLIMLGSEGQGLKDTYMNKAYKKVLIPPAKSSRADSLNVAITAGIIAHVVEN